MEENCWLCDKKTAEKNIAPDNAVIDFLTLPFIHFMNNFSWRNFPFL
jgi:hypothetical protein